MLNYELPSAVFLYPYFLTYFVIFVLVKFWTPSSFVFPSGDSSHKIPISNFESGHNQATVLQNLYRFIHPNPGNWPPIYCKVIHCKNFFLRHPLRYWKIHERYPKKVKFPCMLAMCAKTCSFWIVLNVIRYNNFCGIRGILKIAKAECISILISCF